MSPEILLNNRKIDLDLSDVKNLSDLLKTISEKHLSSDEVITNVLLNNDPLDDESFLLYKDKILSEINSLALTTSTDPTERASSLLREVANYMDNLSTGLRDVADVLRMGEIEKANSLLLQGIDGISSFMDLVGAIKTLAKSDLSDLILEDGSLGDLEGQLFKTLNDLKEGQESKDWVTVADLLEYELSPIMERWRAAIPELQRKIS